MAASNPSKSRWFVTRSADYGVVEVTGADRARWLHGLTSNDVKSLKPGEGNYALFLTGKGKIIAESWVLCLEGRFLVVSRPEHRTRVAQTLDRYLLMDDVVLTDRSSAFLATGLHGPDVSRIPVHVTEVSLPSHEGHHMPSASFDGGRVVAVNEHGWPGYLTLVPIRFTVGRFAEFFPEGHDPAEGEVLRIENGVPRWGSELNEETIPIEAGLEARAISYDKGCYVGQEIIARIKTYGEVAKKLWGVRWGGEGTVAPTTAFSHDGTDAGWVTSSAVSPQFGPISLAYVRRGHGEAGVEVRTPEGRVGALTLLPFSR